MEINGEDLLASLNRLLEELHQTGLTDFGSHLSIVYVASGAQYVSTIHNQYPQPLPANPRKRGNDAAGVTADPPFDADTPLSALFRENHHEELRKVIDSWRPYLIDDDPSIDAFDLTRFEFDKKHIYSNRVYYDLLDLDAIGALKVSLSDLARYLADHSNLSNSYATLYRLLKKYRQERP